jgi:hypothetical protein
MRTVILLGTALLLASCAPAVVMRNADTGELAQCQSDQSFGLLYRWANDRCAEQYERAGWQRM